MSFNRRKFLNSVGKFAGTFALSSFLQPALAQQLDHAFKATKALDPEACAREEDFWKQIRLAYTTSNTIIDLNNGGVNPQARVVQEALTHYNRLCNESPSFYMWRHLDRRRDVIRRRLAELGGCSPETVAITRNASESLETIIFGLPLQAGDEVVLSKQGYPNMIQAWKQRASRDGIVLRWLDFELPQENSSYFIEQYRSAINERTKLLHITHIINWNGQVLPVAEIARLAENTEIEVLVDGAHSFAQMEYQIPDLGCDYFGTSLHKWLGAPFGTGLLYVRPEKIGKVYPLFAAPEAEWGNIRKFEHLGTRASATEQAIIPAIDFHQMIGTARKQSRLRFLKNYWIEAAHSLPGFRLHSPKSAAWDCGIALFSIEGTSTREVNQKLWSKYGIHTVAIDWENINGIRVSPNVYTLTTDLDRFVAALRAIITT